MGQNDALVRRRSGQSAGRDSGVFTGGDGLTDNEEREGFLLGSGETVSTNVHEADTDDDGLDDSEEVLKRTSWAGNTYFEVQSNPTVPDTDGEGLEDGTEVNGWNLHVVN